MSTASSQPGGRGDELISAAPPLLFASGVSSPSPSTLMPRAFSRAFRKA
eukprot:CAMPEP_0119214786 /NCGR_PEP_ID=MMETSP1327-20130426/10404_1 /TAXON_ID=38833 /ORGANISM="Micromonas pusilla, Strain RCC2306" /LENGTH=48 /DNA_ID= /DNA_START= /DNA_END= /DNA_ORIENTATION=